MNAGCEASNGHSSVPVSHNGSDVSSGSSQAVAPDETRASTTPASGRSLGPGDWKRTVSSHAPWTLSTLERVR